MRDADVPLRALDVADDRAPEPGGMTQLLLRDAALDAQHLHSEAERLKVRLRAALPRRLHDADAKSRMLVYRPRIRCMLHSIRLTKESRWEPAEPAPR